MVYYLVAVQRNLQPNTLGQNIFFFENLLQFEFYLDISEIKKFRTKVYVIYL